MDLSTLYRTFADHSHEAMTFIYHGDFKDDITELIIELGSANVGGDHGGWISNKVSFLIAECFQNVLQHGDDNENTALKDKSLFSIHDVKETIYISSLNPIKKDQTEELTAFIDNLNTLSKEELTKLYRDVLASNPSEKVLSGIGFIEMARKSGNKLSFYFDDINELMSLFYFQVQFSTEKKISQTRNRINYEISKQTYRTVKHHNIFMIHKGNFSQHTIFPIIEMVEQNLEKHLEVSDRKRSFHILVELLQNISKHGYSENGLTEGIFMLTGEKGFFNILAGNYIENKDIEKLKLLLDFINDNDRDDVIEYYKGILRYGKPTEKGGAGVGLIDILRNSGNSLEYRIFNMNEQLSFYCVKVRIKLKS